VPLAHIKKTGPTIKLTDNKEKWTVFLKKNLADPALHKDLAKLAPGKILVIDWVLTNTELEQFGTNPVDLTVEAIVQSFSTKKSEVESGNLTTVGSIRIHSEPSN
jgi:hypothetical protein